ANEAGGVAEQHRAPARELPAAGAGVERREKLVLGKHVSVGERVHQRALAGVRVADERDGHPIAPAGDFAFFAFLHFLEIATQISDALLGQPTVGFELLFTRAAHTDAHLQPRQMLPHALEARKRVFELSELYVETGL